MEQIKNKIDIKKLILKAMLYIAFLWFVFSALVFLPSLPLAIKFFNPWSEIPVLTDFIYNLTIFYIPTISSIFSCYIMAKLFGIFKFIDNLKTNLFKKLLFLTLIAVLSFLVLFVRFKYVEYAKNFTYYIPSLVFSLIPAFFLYKYFQYLTKKHTIPFEKIGYYSSIEFWKKVFDKIKQSFRF